jgi:hypothetical protein
MGIDMYQVENNLGTIPGINLPECVYTCVQNDAINRTTAD